MNFGSIANIAYVPDSWAGFGAAVATAAAALTGLLFIAVSINLKQILDVKFPGLPSRAAQTLILFATPLIGALLLSVPGQGRVALGAELLAAGLAIGGFQAWLYLTAPRTPEDTRGRRLLTRVFPVVVSYGSMAVAGATLIGAAGGGLYWIVPSVVAALIFGLVNVWVLLVEILR